MELSLNSLNLPEKNIFISNLFLIACCAFYLIWWLLAFNPNGSITGMKTGWILIPASASGLAALILAVRDCSNGRTALFGQGALMGRYCRICDFVRAYSLIAWAAYYDGTFPDRRLGSAGALRSQHIVRVGSVFS